MAITHRGETQRCFVSSLPAQITLTEEPGARLFSQCFHMRAGTRTPRPGSAVLPGGQEGGQQGIMQTGNQDSNEHSLVCDAATAGGY